ncbi:sugar ABC transporter substrate-binding protein [Arthrobacter sp. MMS18-M83]|uniref:sugar ABC transporter substrate-binding protein n=1 Tax=Arthrobacter sp. MMS18-M83 TaxID=2996261 RepID=UPI00227B5A64|nr:sugar ABC transporter substrate-binding protein [Arthrobacter sp. MMS18-M83]WAH97564.1 sugar ABC transporter substrate-binding protein [Arthrobacter sp. MMS18-M83]
MDKELKRAAGFPVNTRVGSSPFRKLTLGIAVAASALLMAGCATAGGAPDAKGATTADLAAAKTIADAHVAAPTTLNQSIPLKGTLPAHGKIIYLNSGLPATTLMVDAAHKAIDAIGWTFEELAYQGSNPATLRSALLTALAKGPKAVLISGDPVSAYGEDVIQQYKDAGIPLIVGSVCPLQPLGSIVQGAVGCDAEAAAGKTLADWFIADSKGVGQVLFENIPAIPSLEAFVKAFKQEVTDKCAACGVQILESTLTQVSQNQVVPTVVNTLRSKPDINYVFFDNAQFSKGITAALKAAGLNGQVKIGGRSMDQGAQGGLMDGSQVAWTAFSYPVAGYSQVDAALRAITHSDGLDKVSVLPFQLVTQESVKGTSVPYNYPTGALEQYLKLWGVK